MRKYSDRALKGFIATLYFLAFLPAGVPASADALPPNPGNDRENWYPPLPKMAIPRPFIVLDKTALVKDQEKE